MLTRGGVTTTIVPTAQMVASGGEVEIRAGADAILSAATAAGDEDAQGEEVGGDVEVEVEVDEWVSPLSGRNANEDYLRGSRRGSE